MRINSNGFRLNVSNSWLNKELVKDTSMSLNTVFDSFISNFFRDKRIKNFDISLSHSCFKRSLVHRDLFLFLTDESSRNLLNVFTYNSNERRLVSYFYRTFNLYFYKKLYFIFLKDYARLVDFSPHHKVYLVITSTKCCTASTIANFIVKKLLTRFKVDKIIKSVIGSSELIQAQRSGILIECSGRFDRKERASKVRAGSGKIPLNSISSRVEYSLKNVVLKYGICGIKVWLYHYDKK